MTCLTWFIGSDEGTRNVGDDGKDPVASNGRNAVMVLAKDMERGLREVENCRAGGFGRMAPGDGP